MKWTPGVSIAVLALLCAGSHVSMAQAQSFDGDWVGGTDLFQNPAFVHVRFGPTPGSLANVQSWKVTNRPLTGVRIDGSRIRFEFPSDAGVPYVAEGELQGGLIQGSISRGSAKGKFHLIRVAKVDQNLYDKYVGVYEFADPATGTNKPQLVTYGSAGHLRWVNLETGQTTALFPISNTRFFLGGSVVAQTSPELVTWSFEPAEKGTFTSVLRVTGQKDQSGSRTDLYRQERVTIRNDDVTLAATLMMPSTSRKHPAVVYIPGSGGDQTSRDSSLFREYHQLITNGFAVLIYDKRGTGGSTGDWRTASFESLADDAVAGVAYLTTRAEIDPRHVGVWGFSQGATVAPLAAARSRDVAFVIMMGGGGIPATAAEKNEQTAAMRARGFTAAEINEALAFIDLQFDALRSASGRKKFEAAIPAAREKKWFLQTWASLPPDHWLWTWWSGIVDHDPARVLAQVKVPVLAMFGGGDRLTVPEAIRDMVASIETNLRKGGNRNVTTRVFPEAGHDLSVPVQNGEPVPAAGFHALLVSWLRQTSGGMTGK